MIVTAQPTSSDVLLEKYAKGEERTAETLFGRVARGFIPAGRVTSERGVAGQRLEAPPQPGREAAVLRP
jgi:hypothetical protein